MCVCVTAGVLVVGWGGVSGKSIYGEEAATAIAEALAANTTLTSVNLSGECRLEGARKMRAMLVCSLWAVWRGAPGGGIYDEGATAIAEALELNTTIRSIYLGGRVQAFLLESACLTSCCGFDSCKNATD